MFSIDVLRVINTLAAAATEKEVKVSVPALAVTPLKPLSQGIYVIVPGTLEVKFVPSFRAEGETFLLLW